MARSWGRALKQRSGRFQASYIGPDGQRHVAPTTFDDKTTALLWLKEERQRIEYKPDKWKPPKERVEAAKAKRAAKERKGTTFGEFAETWFATRRHKNGRELSPRTKEHYRKLLDVHILPTFGDMPLRDIEPDFVKAWHAQTLTDAPTMRAHAYSLLRTVCKEAVKDGELKVTPVDIRGAGNVERASQTKMIKMSELATIVENMPERHRLMVLLAAWCGLRFGELVALRRTDVDLTAGVVHIRQGVIRTKGEVLAKAPKTTAGRRSVAIPPHLVEAVEEHRRTYADPSPSGLMFPAAHGGFLAPSALYGKRAVVAKDGTVKKEGSGWYRARQAAGREDLRFHDLRHVGATNAARAGATLAELMHRLGHTTAGAAMRYQVSAADRDAALARKLSEMAERGDDQ